MTCMLLLILSCSTSTTTLRYNNERPAFGLFMLVLVCGSSSACFVLQYLSHIFCTPGIFSFVFSRTFFFKYEARVGYEVCLSLDALAPPPPRPRNPRRQSTAVAPFTEPHRHPHPPQQMADGYHKMRNRQGILRQTSENKTDIMLIMPCIENYAMYVSKKNDERPKCWNGAVFRY